MKDNKTAGILGILLGGLGVHRFYVGNTGLGILFLLLTIFTFGLGGIAGGLDGLISGIMWLSNEDEFNDKYNKKQ